MSPTPHTPGPWIAKAWQVAHEPTSVGRMVDGQFEQVAECVGFGNDTEHGVRNARLIAMSPELLAELQRLVRFHDQLNANDIERAKALIAKATGGAA